MMTKSGRWMWMAVLALVLLAFWGIAQAQGPAGPTSGEPADGDAGSRSALDFITAGGIVGYVIILLSVAGAALVIDGFMRLKEGRLIPSGLVTQSEKLARQGKFSEVYNLCRANDSMISRIIWTALSHWSLGMAAIRESFHEQGTREITRLNQRVGYIGFIAAVAPMLGLLGTVTGMIRSFNILGASKGTAGPDQLAVGIAEALVTTCMGLIVAVPLMFFHNYLRDRITRIGQESGAVCQRLMRQMAAAIATAHNTTAPPSQDDEETVGDVMP